MKRLLARIWKSLGLGKMTQLTIMRFLHDEFLIGVSGVIFDSDNRILLCKHTYRQSSWGLPSGYIKAKEHPTEGLVREIEEETGFIIHIDDVFKIRTDRQTARIEIACMGTYIDGTFARSDEVEDAQFFVFSSLPLLPRQQLVLIDEARRRRVGHQASS